mmetsp:Transcript_15766/g.22506  ORF Transcript_15766/g.22506 Transcript_15766/m.22506 type:complete len:181 (+) Transcript_15766:1615-2157(+)
MQFRQAELPHMNNVDRINQPFIDDAGHHISGLASRDRRCTIEPCTLAKRLGISVHNAQPTLRHTTQLAVRNVSAPLSQRVRTRQAQLRYPRLCCRLYSDTLFSERKSLLGNTCAQAFLASDCGFSAIYGMSSKVEAGDKLNSFITTYGIPEEFTTDGAKEETMGTREFLGRWLGPAEHVG